MLQVLLLVLLALAVAFIMILLYNQSIIDNTWDLSGQTGWISAKSTDTVKAGRMNTGIYEEHVVNITNIYINYDTKTHLPALGT